MRIDFASMAFGYKLTNGTDTPNWSTSLGQGIGYKINDSQDINELVKGMVYSSVRLENVSTRIGKGGREVKGSDPDSPIVNAAVFSNVYVNETLIPGGKIVLLIIKDTAPSHVGRLKLKYGPSNTFSNGEQSFSNDDLFGRIKDTLEMADDACWFVSEINVENQDKVVLKTVVVDASGPVEYLNSSALHLAWEELTPNTANGNVKEGENILFYGVPGSGKSHTIKKEYCDDERYMERIVFHPDYTYSDFIGQILPDSTDGHISYPFVPGPFTRILKAAVGDSNHNYYLIIEELNRGNAPAIFGEVFQLLDRKNGISVYGINNKDIAKEVYGDSLHSVRIPKNLFILATMNTADQNVFTLDVAFKRRWRMRNIESDVSSSELAKVAVCDTAVTWEQFVNTLNPLIVEYSNNNIGNSDKRLGAYFVSAEELKSREYFSEKVLMYLWNDVFSYEPGRVFDTGYTTLEELLKGFRDKGLDVFSISFGNASQN